MPNRAAALRLAGGAIAMGAIAPRVARADSPPLRIGVIQVLSGPMVTMMKANLNAANAWMHVHGDTIAGRKIELIVRDEVGPNPEISKRLAQEMIINDHIDFLIGPFNSANVAAVGPICAQAGVPQLLFNSPQADILQLAPNAIRLSSSDPTLIAPIASFALKSGVKRIYKLILDYSGGIDAGTAFETAFVAGGGTIAGESRVPMTNLDFSPYAQRIKDAAPQGVFAFLSGGGGGRAFLQSFHDAGLSRAGVKLYSTAGLSLDALLPGLGELATGISAATIYALNRDSRENREAIAASRAVCGVDPDIGSIAIWDAMHAISNVVTAQHGNLNPATSFDLLKRTRFISPRGPITIDPQTRDISQNVYIVRADDHGGTLSNTLVDTFPPKGA